VLLGEYIALSGMIPLDADFKSSLLYRMCHQFGAVIEEIITDKTTVLIAARQGTE
jgi:hypothetical protein